MSQREASQRKSRRRRGVLLGAAALLLAPIALAVVFRAEIAERIAVAWLESRGVAVQALDVAALTPDTIELRDLALGERRELTAQRIVLVPEFDGLDVSLQAARIEGLRLTVDLTGEAPPLGNLQPALERLVAGNGGDGGAPALPRIAIEGGELLFDTVAGPRAATLEADLTADGGRVALRLPGAAEYLALTATARRDPASAGETFAVAIDAELRTAGALARLLALPGPAVTAGTLVLEAAGKASLARRRLALEGDAMLAGVALAGGSDGISAHLPFAIEVAEGRATVTLREDAVARVERPARDSLRDLGVPDGLLPLLAGGLNLTLRAGGELPFRLAAAPLWPPHSVGIAVAARAASDQGLALTLQMKGDATLGDDLALAAFAGDLEAHAEAARLSLGDRAAREVALSLPLTADYDADGLHLALTRPGRLHIAGFAGTAVQAANPLDFEIGALSLDAPSDAAGYRYRLGARAEGAAFTVTVADAGPLAVTTGALALQLDGGFHPPDGHEAELAARLDGLALPDHGFDAEAAEIAVTLDRALRPAEGHFTLGPFRFVTGRSVAGQPLTAPLTLAGDVRRKDAGYDIAATLALSGGQTLVDFSGRYEDGGRASLEAVSRLLAFSPDGLQPQAIAPPLAVLENVDGTASAKARLALPVGGPPGESIEGSGRLRLAGLSFQSQAVAVQGLDLALELDSLLPPASAAGQHLTLRRLDAGVPLEAIDIRFSLDPAPRPHLEIEGGGFDLGGARWRVEPTVLDPAAARNRVVLATDGLDLATFFELIEIDGLAGSGTLAGRLPIVFAGDDDVIVDEGRFEALGPGRLSLRFEGLRRALAGGGETVEMAMKALEDFHYQELSLTLSKTADNDATVKLSTLGQNPDVMDGQPFRFNINLESNLTSVLEALRKGYSLSDDALRRAWRLSE